MKANNEAPYMGTLVLFVGGHDWARLDFESAEKKGLISLEQVIQETLELGSGNYEFESELQILHFEVELKILKTALPEDKYKKVHELFVDPNDESRGYYWAGVYDLRDFVNQAGDPIYTEDEGGE